MVEFDVNDLAAYDGLILGTYTWGDGDLPARVDNFLLNLKQVDTSHLVTAVFGTGETNYREFCGGVDILRDYLKDTSNLAVTLKVEQLYQDTDLPRIDKFCELFNKRLKERP
ncbi:hypothetical protein A3781_19810 [Bacillus badius]|nr:hypothetical protein A3781_19810 [Bacillus badius]